MFNISSALYRILCASDFSTILVFRKNLWSHVTRHLMTDKILEQINQPASKSVEGFKRYAVKSLGVIYSPYGTN